jgi:hypothetical protein
MSRKQSRKKRPEKRVSPPQKTPQTVLLRYLIALVGFALMIGAFVVCIRLLGQQDSPRASDRTERSTSAKPQEDPADGESTAATEPGEDAEAEPNTAPDPATAEKLVGSWHRTDERRYLIEIESVDDDGVMKASYFNPSPINVSKAEATLQDDTVQVFVELRDVNYPGSTYRLEYDPEQDQLAGTYFQPAYGQEFPVTFVRLQ